MGNDDQTALVCSFLIIAFGVVVSLFILARSLFTQRH